MLQLGACAVAPMPAATAGFDQVRVLQGDFAAMNVGTFRHGPEVSDAADQTLVVRAGTMTAPGGSFSQYLADTLTADLKAAGHYDPNAKLEITGLLVDTHVDTFGATAHARLSGEFTLTREGAVVYKKRLEVSSEWNSDFIGAVAIPEAMTHYSALYQKLAGALFADDAFRRAAKGP
jgi:hypothetical protein